HRFALVARGIANPAAVGAPADFWQNLQSAAAADSGAEVCGHAMRIQGLHPAGRANYSAVAAYRALGLRSGNSFSGAQVRLPRRGSPRTLGAQRADKDSPGAGWGSHVSGDVAHPLV